MEPSLIDQHGRTATDLRISLTDKCNLRCRYCMPAEGLPWLSGDEVLTDDEVLRLLRIGVEQLGITAIRFTGGEPLVRPGIVDLIARTRSFAAAGVVDLALTTNGLVLDRLATGLREAGLDRINVSLDTLNAETFANLTRRDRLDDVLKGLAAARDAGLTPVKINSVLMRGINDLDAVDLLDFCVSEGYELRFIEQMPLDADHQWSRDNLVSAEEILERLSVKFTLTPAEEARGSAPAERWLIDGGPATVGVIASVTRPFCRACTRTRITADGQVRHCLFASTETDLRGLLRDGSSDDAVAARWAEAMWGKPRAHGSDDLALPDLFADASRSMSAIGG